LPFLPIGPLHPVIVTQPFPVSGIVGALLIGLVAIALIDGYEAYHNTK